MFSWSSSSAATKTYPAQRRTQGTASPLVATAIQGSIRPPEYSRSQHLESYLNDTVLKPSTRKVQGDDDAYDTVFQTTKGQTLIIRVRLPSRNGSGRAPGMALVGVKGTHPWLDSRMRIIGYDPIKSDSKWKAKRILLGAAVHEVVKHLQLNPPTLSEITDPGLRAIQPKTNGTTPTASPTRRTDNGFSDNDSDAPPDYSTLLNSAPDVELPQIPASFDALEDLSREDMETLLEDEIQFMAFANKLPIMEKLLEVRCSVLNENAEKAKTSLEKEQHLKNLHQQVKQLMKELRSGVEEFQVLQKKQDALCAPPDKSKVLKQLTKAKKEAFEKSERIAENWIEDGGSVDDFVREFTGLRMTHHERAAKIELLQTQNKRL